MRLSSIRLTICKSAMSPEAPRRVFWPIGCSRSMSLKRAREPYEARLSAAIITPSAYLIAITEVPVTIGCLAFVSAGVRCKGTRD